MLTQGMVIAANAMAEKPEVAILCGDSECSIAALEKAGGVLGPFFANRVSEIHENLRQLGDVVENVEPVYHLPGEQNPADLGTREHAALSELGSDSVWQRGPHFLTEMDRNKWPLTRDFRDSVPQSELRSKHEVTKQVYNMQVKVGKSMAVIQKLVEASLCTNSWMKSQGILARLLRAFCYPKDKDRRNLVEVHPEPQDLEAARRVQFLISMQDTFEAIKKGKLKNLNVSVNDGLVEMTGRFREKDLCKIAGKR